MRAGALWGITLALYGLTAHAEETCVRATDTAIISKFNHWNLALASMDPHEMSQLYWPDAVLLSDPHRAEIAGSNQLTEYFSDLMRAHPRARVDSRHVYNGCGFSIDVGHYTVSTMNNEGLTEDHSGIYSFVYLARNGQWKILHQNFTPIEEDSESATPHTSHEDHHDSGHAAPHNYPQPEIHSSNRVEAHAESHSESHASAHTEEHSSGQSEPASADHAISPKEDSGKNSAEGSHAKSAHSTQEASHAKTNDEEHSSSASESHHTKPKADTDPETGSHASNKPTASHNAETHSEMEAAVKTVPAYLLRTGENLAPTSFLKAALPPSPDTVGLKVCVSNGQTTAVVVDPSSVPGLNEAAIAWGQASHWTVAGGHDSVVCSHVVARFPAGKSASAESGKDTEKESSKEPVKKGKESSEHAKASEEHNQETSSARKDSSTNHDSQ